jgi:hypothetical protein
MHHGAAHFTPPPLRLTLVVGISYPLRGVNPNALTPLLEHHQRVRKLECVLLLWV